MRAHLAYLRYVLRHKWYVFIGCMRLRVPLHQAVIHDWVKFLPVEWPAYVRQFYNADGTKRQVHDASGGYDPNKQALAFKRAWLHHQRQPHHWQAWLSIGDGGNLTALPIPERFAREMVADWYGAGKAIAGRNEVAEWYAANGHKMILDDGTRARVEELVQLVAGYAD